MNIDYLNEIITLYSKIKDNKEMISLVNDIKTIDFMILNNFIDNNELNKILDKYQEEINILSNLEKTVNNRCAVNRNNSYNYLHSVKYTLVRVGLIKLSRSKGKEFLKDKLVGDNKVIFELVCQIIDDNKSNQFFNY